MLLANHAEAPPNGLLYLSGAGWDTINPATPRFSDVPPSSPYYTVIETAACYGVVSGYADGSFRPYAQIEAAACRYFRGDYIKQSLAAVGSKDASYFYVQLTLNL